MNITVYLGSSFGSDPSFRQVAEQLGTWIGEHGHTLVYGGSSVGCMGALADATLAAGGKVIGVEPRFMVDRELQHEGITELLIVHTMAERMTKMIDLGDAFIALPGGIGTLEEISEVASRVRLDLTQAPCVFYNYEGFYDHLHAFFEHMLECGFIPPEKYALLTFANTFDELVDALHAPPASEWW